MAFTYTGTLDSDLERVRFYVGDTVSGNGPRPNDLNFTDAELAGLISTEGSWQRAIAAGCEVLAVEWTRFTTFSADGASVSQSDVAAGYREQAKLWRRKAGGVGSRAVTRADGYSHDLDSETC
jgi:hypothetical protein